MTLSCISMSTEMFNVLGLFILNPVDSPCDPSRISYHEKRYFSG